MSEYYLEASVQYNDMKGTAAADWQSRGLTEFVKDCGVDVSKYNPIGIRITLGEMREGKIHEGYVKIIAVNQEVVGTTYEEVVS